jgi:hypothetical protein
MERRNPKMSYVFCEKRKGKKVHIKICKVCEEENCKVKKELGIIRIAKKAPKEESDGNDVE